MQLFVDDEREAPEGWLVARDAMSAINILESQALSDYPVEEVSLDHDLGDLENDPELTGYTVFCWVEEKAHLEPDFIPPYIRIHSANAPARAKMVSGNYKLQKLRRERLEEGGACADSC